MCMPVVFYSSLIRAGDRPRRAVKAIPYLIAALAAMCAPEARGGDETATPPAAQREFRGVWVATVANIDWPSRPGLSVDTQRQELTRIMDRASDLRCNAIVLQVRPCADALYVSQREPWSEFLTGRMGQGPQPHYDPLSLAVKEAQRRGLELHAWFNPFRAGHPAQDGPVSEDHISRSHPELVRAYGKYLWLDPGEPAAVTHSLDVILDVVERYDIDGVHLDDYFYPYPIRDDAGRKVPFPDDAAWEQAQRQQKGLSRDDWRRGNVDRFIERLYRRIKQTKPWVKLGISPFGIWRPGYPEGIEGFDAYANLYADARKWQQEGWLDYLSPQLYWPIDSSGQSFPALLRWWRAQNRHRRHLWPGLFTSRVGMQGRRAWPPDEIVAQIRLARRELHAPGHIHFSMKPLLENRQKLGDRLMDAVYRTPALVPASPWLGAQRPPLPVLSVHRDDAEQNIAVVMSVASPPKLWVVRVLRQGQWDLSIRSGHEQRLQFDLGTTTIEPPSRVAVSAVNRQGIEGPVAVVSLR